MMLRRLRQLCADERGTSVVELALIAPIFGLMVVGVVDLSNAYGRKLGLEQGAQRAIEKIMQTTQTDTVEGTLKTEAVCQVNGLNQDGTCKTSPITVANVTVTYRLDCKNMTSGAISSSTTVDGTAFDTLVCATASDKPSRYISVRVEDVYQPMFPVRFANYNATKQGYPMTATAGMRTD